MNLLLLGGTTCVTRSAEASSTTTTSPVANVTPPTRTERSSPTGSKSFTTSRR